MGDLEGRIRQALRDPHRERRRHRPGWPGTERGGPGPGYYQARTDTDHKLRNHIRQIQALGFTVALTKAG